MFQIPMFENWDLRIENFCFMIMVICRLEKLLLFLLLLLAS